MQLQIMYQDEAIFGRINKMRSSWAPLGVRPNIPQQQVRECIHAYGATSPIDGEHFFMALPQSNTKCMNIFLEELSAAYSNKFIALICDNASWHKSKELVIPDNIKIIHIPACTPEMNPIEQVWSKIRELGFANHFFPSLDLVLDRLFHTVQSLDNDLVRSIVYRGFLDISV